MIKPNNCSYCNSENLTLFNNLEVFNPDTDDYDIINKVYKCDVCGTIHVNNEDFRFIQINIRTDKHIQTTDCNIGIAMCSAVLSN